MAGMMQGNGDSGVESMLSQIMGSMKPNFPTGAQAGQAAMGQQAQFAQGHGFDKIQRFGLLSESKRSFLKKYNGGLSRPAINPTIKPADMLKF